MTEQLPPDVIAELTALGPEITPELGQASWALLRPFHDKVGYTAPSIKRDLRYGEHERHRLDVRHGVARSRLPDLHRPGRFPVDRLVRNCPFAEVSTAIADSLAGITSKPALTFG